MCDHLADVREALGEDSCQKLQWTPTESTESPSMLACPAHHTDFTSFRMVSSSFVLTCVSKMNAITDEKTEYPILFWTAQAHVFVDNFKIQFQWKPSKPNCILKFQSNALRASATSNYNANQQDTPTKKRSTLNINYSNKHNLVYPLRATIGMWCASMLPQQWQHSLYFKWLKWATAKLIRASLWYGFYYGIVFLVCVTCIILYIFV